MRALSVRQPYAELILRGIKTAELRTRTTSIVGERFYLYACKARAKRPIWSDDLEVVRPPLWMVELAAQVKIIEPELISDALPTGVLVGSAVIERVVPPDPRDAAAGRFRWILADVQRLTSPIKPNGHPQPTWFWPFGAESN